MHRPPADRTTLIFAVVAVSIVAVTINDVAHGQWWQLLLLPMALFGCLIGYRSWRERQAERRG